MNKLIDELIDAVGDAIRLEQALKSGETANDVLTGLVNSRTRVEQLKSTLVGKHQVSIDGHQNIVAQDGSLIINLVTGSREDPTSKDALAGYLSWIYGKSERLDLGAFEPDATDGKGKQFSLESVYVALMTLRRDGREKADLEERFTENRPVSALALLNRHKRLVLLGGPGSGKTTFVNYLVLCLAGERLGEPAANLSTLTAPLPDEAGDDAKEPQPWSHGPLLPLPVVLRDFVARGKLPQDGGQGRAKHLWDFIRSELTNADKRHFFATLKATLESKEGGLVLFDGLDEVPEAHKCRSQVLQAVQEFADGLPYCRFLVTSRTYAYQRQGWRLEGFDEALLAPLSDGQVRRFADCWYRESSDKGRVAKELWPKRAELLKQAVFRNARIRELVSSPLLLTMAANLHAHRQGKLPERRHVLYEEILKMLLEVWESRRVVLDASGRPKPEYSLCEVLDVGIEKICSALQKTAYEVHAGQPDLQGTGDVPEDLLIKHLSRLRDDCRDMPRQLIGHLRDRSGILSAHGEGIYRFPHRSLQEYLAACHLITRDYPDNVSKLARNEPDRWREVALLAGAGARVSPFGLCEALCFKDPKVPQDPADHWGAFLAGQLLAESDCLGEAEIAERHEITRKRIYALHVSHLLASDVLPARDRVAAAKLLPRLGGERLEILDPDAMPFCWVPSGPFTMGSDNDPEAYPDEKPSHSQPVDYGYWLARWPVTTAQFRVFVETGGYQKHDPDSLKGPLGAPVVDVNWHDAMTFCRWLENRWQKKGWLPEGYHVVLPSELEWEKAARGGVSIPQPANLVACLPGRLRQFEADQKNKAPLRRYPWGNNPDLERANYDMHIGEVSPVGCYPNGAGPYGCEEMSGNVFEWTRSRYENYPYPSTAKERRAREDLASHQRRVLRGGGFSNNTRDVRCACRYDDEPDIRNDDFGFRVVLSPFTLNSDASGL